MHLPTGNRTKFLLRMLATLSGAFPWNNPLATPTIELLHALYKYAPARTNVSIAIT
jgi:hypothetical protein